ncbi:phosphoribosylglycinamide formyltransferase [Ethanoligenens harbinense]|uniref:Phosphoribosylglycinamide formyltransferase n=1 Tax=Ethanoligenens harbinense (strain DSM 18485 / JCM 12961 / CGMCC 1.5033 / YUAN-3) TaxID=663278 RepID=E6U6P6_ETHHY|nr:phosphoribosylglycinamide formyltransferase [Ethanoligenens harbinense]ADU25779.1 phosphoribosylglycinamide formyltransferase [Ethanoligenens harbinense YUAN-3]AVQ94948.1 phosphoribosylglycinamide formyltransferase [Ethanoligenens harbinense YUAN-3]AYF37640.1 phosphoribosylglycinamide formyltransferase [Ethanoligenens harbinense]AYF40360.1 phosphoribosylglycinamide formyltransferase [Ethanoligenens harbinense]QCN91196.1 phosphoribosylglycinamide formyltransferase [Ethanoligenens harbinense]
MVNIAVLVSGGGTNLQALIDAVETGKIHGRIVLVAASKPGVFALERARKHGIPSCVARRADYADPAAFEQALLAQLDAVGADLVVLAGYLSILGRAVTDAYKGRMINVHPSLIPSFCGPGYYGLRVHEAALAYGVKVTGATVHFVNEVTDGGAIILQKAVEVRQGDTAEALQQRVMRQAEWEILPRAVALFCDGRLEWTDDGKVIIKEQGEQE